MFYVVVIITSREGVSCLKESDHTRRETSLVTIRFELCIIQTKYLIKIVILKLQTQNKHHELVFYCIIFFRSFLFEPVKHFMLDLVECFSNYLAAG